MAFMPRMFRRRLAAILALILLLLGLILTVTQWLPRLVGIWLPEDTRIELSGAPRWREGGLWLPQLRYLAGIAPGNGKGVSLGWHQSRWKLNASELTLDSTCLQNYLPVMAARQPPKRWPNGRQCCLAPTFIWAN